MRYWLSGPRIMGIRPGVSFGREDFRKLTAKPVIAQMTAACPQFVYVIRDAGMAGPGFRKIGISTNPNARLAQLRTASPYPLDLEFVAMVSGEALSIEQEAHKILNSHRRSGEWFAVEADMAAAAISAAAFRLNQRFTTVAPHEIDLAIAAAQKMQQPAPKNNQTTLWAIVWLLALVFIMFVVALMATATNP